VTSQFTFNDINPTLHTLAPLQIFLQIFRTIELVNLDDKIEKTYLKSFVWFISTKCCHKVLPPSWLRLVFRLRSLSESGLCRRKRNRPDVGTSWTSSPVGHKSQSKTRKRVLLTTMLLDRYCLTIISSITTIIDAFCAPSSHVNLNLI